MNVKLSVFLGFIIDGILFPIQSLITRSNSQRLPVTQYRLHSKVIFPLVINYYTLSGDANLGCLCKHARGRGGGGVLSEFLGGDVPLGPWNP